MVLTQVCACVWSLVFFSVLLPVCACIVGSCAAFRLAFTNLSVRKSLLTFKALENDQYLLFLQPPHPGTSQMKLQIHLQRTSIWFLQHSIFAKRANNMIFLWCVLCAGQINISLYPILYILQLSFPIHCSYTIHCKRKRRKEFSVCSVRPKPHIWLLRARIQLVAVGVWTLAPFRQLE